MGFMVPVDVVKTMMGRKGYLTEASRKYSVENLSRFFKQDETLKLIFTEAEEVGKGIESRWRE